MKIYKVILAILLSKVILGVENPGIHITLGTRALDFGKLCRKVFHPSLRWKYTVYVFIRFRPFSPANKTVYVFPSLLKHIVFTYSYF